MDGVTGSKSSTSSKCGMSVLKFSRSSYLDNHLFMLGPRVPYRVGSHCITFDLWVLARVVVEAKTSKFSKCDIFASECL